MFGGEIEVRRELLFRRQAQRQTCERGAAGKIPVSRFIKKGWKGLYQDHSQTASGATLIPITERKMDRRTASSILTAGAAIMYWMCQTSITSVSTILSSSQTATITSMALRISGTRPSGTCANSTVFPRRILGYSLRECEWRFNNSDPSAQLSQLRQWVRRYLN